MSALRVVKPETDPAERLRIAIRHKAGQTEKADTLLADFLGDVLKTIKQLEGRVERLEARS